MKSTRGPILAAVSFVKACQNDNENDRAFCYDEPIHLRGSSCKIHRQH